MTVKLFPGPSLQASRNHQGKSGRMTVGFGRWVPMAGKSFPVGMMGARLEVNVHIITGSQGSTQNIVACVNRAGVNVAETVVEQLAASESVPAAFGIFALADGDPVRAARLAFSLSGDADTIGAIACAICGGLQGAAAAVGALRVHHVLDDGVPLHACHRAGAASRGAGVGGQRDEGGAPLRPAVQAVERAPLQRQ